MLRSNNTKWIFILMLCLLFSACTKEPANIDPIKPFEWWTIEYSQPNGKPVFQSLPKLPWLSNPVIISEKRIDHGTIISIDGLTDYLVEERINRIIEAKSLELIAYDETNLPPYQGIASKLKDASLLSRNFQVNVTFNANFVLSLFFEYVMEFSLPDYTTKQLFVYDGLTFDLNTGDEISLSDLLLNHVDAKNWYNDFMLKNYIKGDAIVLDPWSYPLELKEPFRGVRHNQKFFLSNSALQLIYDFKTTEVVMDEQPMILTIFYSEIENEFALNQRFLTQHSVFELPITQGFFSFSRQRQEIFWDQILYRNYTIQTTFQNYKQIDDIPYSGFHQLVSHMIDTLDLLPRTPNDIFLGYNEYVVGPFQIMSATYYFEDEQSIAYTDSITETYTSDKVALTMNQLILGVEKYDQELEAFLIQYLKGSYQPTIDYNHFSYHIHSFSVGFEGFDAFIWVDGLQEPVNISLPYAMFELGDLPMFQPILQLIS